MTPQARLRRIGWFALLGVCTLLYALLHLQVWAVSSEVKRAERRIVALESNKMLLETEFLTRSSQLQLSAWNRVDFGYTAPRADQFIGTERQLASLGVQGDAAEQDLRLASFSADQDVAPFPQLVSPITGEPMERGEANDAEAPQVAAGDAGDQTERRLVAALAAPATRTAMHSRSRGGAATVRVVLGGAVQ
jgi:hypothetical protein